MRRTVVGFSRSDDCGAVTDLRVPSGKNVRPALTAMVAAEEERFAAERPKSKALGARACRSLLGGVPMTWMLKWPGTFPLFFEEARGARLVDVDGHEYVDLCLGDTAAMAGHARRATVEAVAERAAHGSAAMLPTEDAVWVGEELHRRFGLPLWQFALTATDANRFALRLARQVTGRRRILVFNYCYHGTVDETIVTVRDGVTRSRPGNVGPAFDPSGTSRVVEFNDAEALDRELAAGDVACVLAEPAMTNVGIVLPEPGFLAELRAATERHGALLIFDETHTMCAGPGGMTGRDELTPDAVTIGKAIGGGIPAAAYGVSAALGERIMKAGIVPSPEASGGVGGTLAGNALSAAAVRATLQDGLSPASFAHTIPLAGRFADGVSEAIARADVPWHVIHLGSRAEYRFAPVPPRTGNEAAGGSDAQLARYLHVFALNRGVLLTPFHSMALMSPDTTTQDVDRHTEVFGLALDALVAAGVV